MLTHFNSTAYFDIEFRFNQFQNKAAASAMVQPVANQKVMGLFLIWNDLAGPIKTLFSAIVGGFSTPRVASVGRKMESDSGVYSEVVTPAAGKIQI